VIERKWQINAKKKFLSSTALSFLLNATPGAGKTIFSALCAKALYESGQITFTLIVVPTVTLKGDREAGFLGDWNTCGIQLTTNMRSGQGIPREFQGGVVTYQQLLNMVETIKIWVRNGCRLFLVFDEVHHLTELNQWGTAAEQIGDIAARILTMTGTAFRSDGRKISFVNYDADGKAIADDTYSYEEAVAGKICRPVEFMTDDGIAEFIKGEKEETVRISEPETQESESDASRTIFRGESNWLREVIMRADARLDEYRTWDSDAGGLIICRPGRDERDNRHLLRVANLVEEVTGEKPEVVYFDDDESTAKIERFRKSGKKWICAVRKISEGVDIKRLRVEILATRPGTELLFRQVIGRIVRVDNPERPGDATVFMAKFPQLVEWAKRIRGEAEAGLQEIAERVLRDEEEEEEERQRAFFIPGSSTFEAGGAVSDFGEEYSAAEINAAENLKKQAVEFMSVPTTTVAKMLRLSGKTPEPLEPAGIPLQERKKDLRGLVNKAVRRLAYALRDDAMQEPDFGFVWNKLNQSLGVKSLDDLADNYSIAVMEQALSLLNRWYGDNAS
jgi:superfamily II DNA or RNA helicase